MEKKMRKVELQELLSLGLADEAGRVYSNSDSDIFAEGDGLFTIKERGDLVSAGNTAAALNEYFLESSKADFEEMIRDWQADHSPEYDDMVVDIIEFDQDWTAYAHDSKATYTLADDGNGNIRINYLGSR